MAANGALKIKKNIISLGTKTSAPAGAVKGDIYITAAGTMQVHNGSGFGSLSSNEDAATLQNKTIVAPIFSSYTDFAEIATPVSPAAGNVRVYAKSDKKLYQKDSLGTEALIGSGGGGSGGTGVNLIDNPDDSNGWGVSGGVTATTVTANNPLAGVTDTAIELAAGSVNDYARYRFTLPNGLKNTPLVVSLYTGASVSDDWEVEMFSNTLSNYTGTYAELPLPSSLVKSGQGQFRTFFIPDSVNVYHELRLKRVAGSSVLRATAVTVGPQALSNGPAVSDWQSYTPTLSNSTNITITDTRWRRVGSEIEIHGNIGWVGAGAGGAFSVSLPSGYEMDIINRDSANILGYGLKYVQIGTTRSAVSVVIQNSTSFGFNLMLGAASTLSGTDFVADDRLSFNVTIPIVGWSSNVTMADRAVEEYASNSSTTNADDLTSFVNGIDGSLCPGALTELRTKRIRFQTPIQPTDKISIEILDNGGRWVEVGETYAVGINGYPVNSFTYTASGAATNAVGIGWVGVSGNNTDLNVQFGAVYYASLDGGSTQGWNLANSQGNRWRVRKVSSGAAVGFPVGARNVVGDTSGTVVPAGMIGETLTTLGAETTSSSNGDVTFATLPLTVGVWKIEWHAWTTNAISTNTTARFRAQAKYANSSFTTSNATNTDNSGVGVINFNDAAYAGGMAGSIPGSVVVATGDADKNVYLRGGPQNLSAGTAAWRGRLTATRIA